MLDLDLKPRHPSEQWLQMLVCLAGCWHRAAACTPCMAALQGFDGKHGYERYVKRYNDLVCRCCSSCCRCPMLSCYSHVELQIKEEQEWALLP